MHSTVQYIISCDAKQEKYMSQKATFDLVRQGIFVVHAMHIGYTQDYNTPEYTSWTMQLTLYMTFAHK